MARLIEDYALLSDCHSAALVDREGSIDWLTFPCFDSAACFASLLGDRENGHWSITPAHNHRSSRRYIEDTLVLETIFEGPEGSFKLTDCLLINEENPTLVRMVEGLAGSADVTMEVVLRFDYGSIVPWVRRNVEEDGIHAVAGPEAVVLYSDVPLKGKDLHTETRFRVSAGEKKSFSLIWYPSNMEMPGRMKDLPALIDATAEHWKNWARQGSYHGFDEDSVKRSLLTLKGLSYRPTGAIIAAATTSLPEDLGGVRNWDYRYGWIRDSSFTLYALIQAGFKEEAVSWKEWLHRAVAGTPSQVNIMYGIRGERRLTEIELPWLNGYEDSRPVRIGNDAYTQFQLDVFGELLSTSNLGRKFGIPINEDAWRIERHMVEYVYKHWREPDDGIWEVRGKRRQFTHSKFMAWVAMKSAVEAIELYGCSGDLESWKLLRDRIHRDICENGFNRKLNAFVQYYGSSELDASLLMMGHYGFLPPNDPRMVGTVEAILKNLTTKGHVQRYRTEGQVDGLFGNEGSFIACSFWLVDNLRMMGRTDEALEYYRELQKIKNDVGLYAEEYLVSKSRMVGNFPQAFSHIAEVVSAIGFQEAHTRPCLSLTHPNLYTIQ